MQDVLLEEVIQDDMNPTTLAEARPKVNTLMMLPFLYDSLGATPHKSLVQSLGSWTKISPTFENRFGPYLCCYPSLDICY